MKKVSDDILKEKYGEDILKSAKDLVDSFDEWLKSDMPEEEDNSELAIGLKKHTDFSFNASFNQTIYDKFVNETDLYYFEGTPFRGFREDISSLYLYYQYLKRFINYYVEEASKYYERQRKIAEAADELEGYDGFWKYEPELDATKRIYQIEYENIVMSLYTVFERFLKRYIKDNDPNSEVLRRSQGDHTVLDYMQYLRNKGIFVPRELFDDFDKIRLIRNHFVHSNDTIGFKLRRSLEKDKNDILQNDQIVINEKFIEASFISISEIVRCIEKA